MNASAIVVRVIAVAALLAVLQIGESAEALGQNAHQEAAHIRSSKDVSAESTVVTEVRNATIRMWEEETGLSWDELKQYADDPAALRFDFVGMSPPYVGEYDHAFMWNEPVRLQLRSRTSLTPSAEDITVLVPFDEMYIESDSSKLGFDLVRQIYSVGADGVDLLIDQGFPQAPWDIAGNEALSTMLLMEALSVVDWSQEVQEALLAGTYLQGLMVTSNPWFARLQDSPPQVLRINDAEGIPRAVYAIDGLWDLILVNDDEDVNKRIRIDRDYAFCKVEVLTQIESPEEPLAAFEVQPWEGGDEWKDALLGHYLLLDLARFSAVRDRDHILTAIFTYLNPLKGLTLGGMVEGTRDAMEGIKVYHIDDPDFDKLSIARTSDSYTFPFDTVVQEDHKIIATGRFSEVDNEGNKNDTIADVEWTMIPVRLDGSLRFHVSASISYQDDPEDTELLFDELFIPVPRER